MGAEFQSSVRSKTESLKSKEDEMEMEMGSDLHFTQLTFHLWSQTLLSTPQPITDVKSEDQTLFSYTFSPLSGASFSLIPGSAAYFLTSWVIFIEHPPSPSSPAALRRDRTLRRNRKMRAVIYWNFWAAGPPRGDNRRAAENAVV